MPPKTIDLNLEYSDPQEIAGIWLGHLRQCESDRLNATLRAARAKASGLDDQAKAEQETADQAGAGLEAILAALPENVREVMEAIKTQQAKAAENQRKLAAKALEEEPAAAEV